MQQQERSVAADVGIEQTPDVCGGTARVAGTRFPVWTIERFREVGASVQDLLTYFPTLSAAQVERALDYVRTHPHKISEEILQNESLQDESFQDESRNR